MSRFDVVVAITEVSALSASTEEFLATRAISCNICRCLCFISSLPLGGKDHRGTQKFAMYVNSLPSSRSISRYHRFGTRMDTRRYTGAPLPGLLKERRLSTPLDSTRSILAPMQMAPPARSDKFPPPALQEALAASVAGGTLSDTAYYLYSQRLRNWKIGKPRIVYANSLVLKDAASHFVARKRHSVVNCTRWYSHRCRIRRRILD